MFTIIPAIDIIDGKCVRLTRGDYSQQKVYSNNPLDIARLFEDAGIKRLHMVDLDGAKAGRLINLKVLEAVASQTKLQIDFGGGIKNINDVESVLNAGAVVVTVGSMAIKHPELLEEWLIELGTERFFVGADVLNEKIRISGWLEDTGVDIYSFVGNMIGLGVANIFCTDISKDGVMQGPSVDLYKKIIAEHPEIKLVASGGVSTVNDLELLKDAGCAGAIIGKAIYEGSIQLDELSAFC